LRLILAFRCFFNILFSGHLSDEVLTALRLPRRDSAPKPAAASAPKASAPATPAARTSDGALQMLAILQREGRLVDFLMEDISSYSDDQVGAAVRELHDQCRDGIARHMTLEPIIDGVEGTFANAPSKDPSVVRFVGNVPAKPPAGGTLRHKGWRAAKVTLPAPPASQDAVNIAPAELEVE
jgi:hypothetical protein